MSIHDTILYYSSSRIAPFVLYDVFDAVTIIVYATYNRESFINETITSEVNIIL